MYIYILLYTHESICSQKPDYFPVVWKDFQVYASLPLYFFYLSGPRSVYYTTVLVEEAAKKV